MTEKNEKNIDDLQTSADELLSKLNGQYEQEKTADDAESKAGAAKAELDRALGGGLSGEQYDELYAKYLGEKTPEDSKTDESYEALKNRLTDIQSIKPESVTTGSEPDDGAEEIATVSELPSLEFSKISAEDEPKTDFDVTPNFVIPDISFDADIHIDEETADDEKASDEETEEYWNMMKGIRPEKPDEDSEGEEETELQKNIADAVMFVEENPDVSEVPAKPEKNIAEPEYPKLEEDKSKSDKKSLWSLLRGEKHEKKSKESDQFGSDRLIDKLGDTDELLAFEEKLPETKSTVKKPEESRPVGAAAEKPVVAEKPVAAEKPAMAEKPAASEMSTDGLDDGQGEKLSDTEMMMMAFGYEPQKTEKKKTAGNYEEYEFSETDELATSDNLVLTNDLIETDTVQMDVGVKEMFGKPTFEYTGSEKNQEIFDTFKSKFGSLKLRMFICAVIAAGLLIWEFVLPLFHVALDPYAYIAVDWILTFGAALAVCDRMVIAVKNIARLKFDFDTVTLVAFFFSALTSIIAVIAYPGIHETVKGSDLYIVMFNFSFALFAFFNLFSAMLLLRRDIYAFKVISSQKTKRMIAHCTPAERSREDIAFSDYISEGSDVCKVKETDFVADFFAGRGETPKSRKPLMILIPAAFFIAIVAFIVSLAALDANAYTAMSNAYIAFMICAPMTVFVSYSYPAFLGALKAYSHDAAILSEATPESYENTAVITFSDEDAFPADRIKIKRIKVIENNSIENVIYYASSVFSKIGGPLASVFRAATLNETTSDNVEIKEFSDGGIDAFVDGKHIVVGQPEYMENQCFETTVEEGDERYGGKSSKRILYLACDEIIIAKFYIQYSSSPDFIYIVKHLYEDGICVAISSIDPSIDGDLLYKNRLDPERYAIKIIKGNGPEEKTEAISSSKGGVVSTGSLKGLVKTLLVCDKLVSIAKTNLAMKIVSALIGAVVIFFLMLNSVSVNFFTIYPALYQLFWMIPMFLVSKFYIK